MLATVLVAGCSASEPLVLATFEGGVITPRDLVAYRPADSTADLIHWVERYTVDAAEQQILLQVAEQRGVPDDPAVRLRARTSVALDLAMRRVGRACIGASAATRPDRSSRPWIQVVRIVRRVGLDTTAAERERARSELALAAAALRDGADPSGVAGQYATDSKPTISRIYPDSALDPVLVQTARGLADGEVSGVIRTRHGFETVLRRRSGVEPAPRFQRTSARLAEALRALRASVCPEALALADRHLPEAKAVEVQQGEAGIRVRVADEVFDRIALAALAGFDGAESLETLPEDIELAFQLAAGAVSEKTRLRLDQAELQRLATLETLVRERRKLIERWTPEELSRFLREQEPRSLGPAGVEAKVRAVASRGSVDLDRQILSRLKREHGFVLHPQALQLYADSLRP